MKYVFMFCLLPAILGAFNVTIVTDPPGPIYKAATWIKFKCVVTDNIQLEPPIMYKWFKICTYNSNYTFLESINDSLWWSGQALSTPISCWDGMNCTITDSNNVTGMASTYFRNIQGVGLKYNLKPISNNTMIIVDGNSTLDKLTCHSGYRMVASGHWVLPNGTILSENTNEFNLFRGGGEAVPLYLEISLQTGKVPTGLYKCIIDNQSLYLWVLKEKVNGQPQLLEEGASSETPFQLFCVFQGAHGNFQWYMNGSYITTNNDHYDIAVYLANITSMVYISILTINSTDPNKWIGEYSCVFDSNVIYHNEEITTSVSHYFITDYVGKDHSVTCPINGPNITSVGVTVDGLSLIPNMSVNESDVIVHLQPIKDIDHGRTFSCHGNKIGGDVVYFNFTFVSIVPYPSLSISFPEPALVRSGDPVKLQCNIYTITPGLTTHPSMFWLGASGSYYLPTTRTKGIHVNTTINNSGAFSQIFISALNVSLAGFYTCVGSVATMAITTTPLYISEEQLLAVQIAPPHLHITIETTPLSNGTSLYAGTTATFHCIAEVDSHIDIPIYMIFNWYHGNETVFNTNQIVITNSTQISDFIYKSTLKITPVISSFLKESLECAVTVNHNRTKYLYVIESWEEKEKVSVTILDPNVTVLTEPGHLTAPNAIPYNTFSLKCIIHEPEYLIVPLSIQWELNGLPITEDQDNVIQLDQITKELILDIENETIGTHQYHCRAFLNLPGDKRRDFYSISTVNIYGPVPPETPAQVSVISKHSQEVIVYWLVPMVTYTPETYIVSIGTSHEILRPTSSIDGNKDIKLKNQIYSVQLTNLHENTIYYYRILARNKYTSTSTKVQTFTTPSSSLNLDILPIKITSAGLSQSLTCTVYVKNSTLFPPTNITWIRPNGQQGNSDKNVSLTSLDTITNITIHFPVLKTSHAGPYTCQVMLYNGEFANITDYLIVKIPIPTISLSFHPDDPHAIFSGHNVTLTFYVEFSVHLDTNISVATIWRNKSIDMSAGIRTKLFPVHQVGENKYEGSIVLLEVNKYDEGLYECEVTARSNIESVLSVSTTATIQLNIQELPEHNITITTNGNTSLGQFLSLSCVVKIPDSLFDLQTVKWINPNGEFVTEDSNFILTGPYEEGSTVTLILGIKSLKASNAGSYICQAISQVPSVGLIKETNLEWKLVVFLPSPIVSVAHSSSSLYAGSPFNITCKVDISKDVDVPIKVFISWTKEDFSLPNTTRIIAYNAEQYNSHIYVSVLEFKTLSQLIDNGTYECLTLVLPVPTSDVVGPSRSVTIYTEVSVLSPDLSIEVTAPLLSILDVPPYNNFTLLCSVQIPPIIISTMTFNWRYWKLGSINLGTQIRNNSNRFYLDERDFANGTFSSVVSGSEEVPGTYHYTCEVNLVIAEDIQPAKLREIELIVKGSRLPYGVSNITATRGQQVTSAVITWLVSKVSYTPEHYVVQYGRNLRVLESASERVIGSQNLQLSDVIMKVTLTELEVGDIYYYDIISTNSEGSITSEHQQFVAGFQNKLFQVKLNGIHECKEWIFADIAKKKSDVIVEVVNAIEIQCDAGCHLPIDHIQDGHYMCTTANPQEVIFRARLYGTNDHVPSYFVQLLKNWVAQGVQTIVVNSIRLTIDPLCNIEINSFSEPECLTLVTTPTTNNGKGLIYLIIGTVSGVLLVCVCNVIIVCLVHQKTKKKRKRNNAGNINMKEFSKDELSRTTSNYAITSPVPNFEKSAVYIPPITHKTQHSNRFPQTPPPHYMSPHASRSSMLEKPGHSKTHQTQQRDSHIYYLNTPPRHIPPSLLSETDPVYEPIPADESGNQYNTPPQSHHQKPPVPVRYNRGRKGHDRPKKGIEQPLQTQKQLTLEGSERQTPQDINDSDDDYEYMNSVGPIDFSSATI